MDLASYNLMVEKSLKSVVRNIISKVQFSGLDKDKNYYVLSFMADHEGVVIPSCLREKYPKEVTVILQNQFLIKEVSEKQLIVNLAFSGEHSDLTIPFDAISMFYDPYAEFMLKFLEVTKESEDKEALEQLVGKSEIEKKLISFIDFKDSLDK
jgi:hypothetical protein